MMDELVSVILPTYNRAKFISKAIKSVFEQTYRPIELIIVDDGSTDDTEVVVNEWQNKCKNDEKFEIKYHKLSTNYGACVARNKGIEQSSGRYLQYLDSDDYLEPEKISKQLQVMQEKNTPICLCDFKFVDENGNTTKKIRNDKSLSEFIRYFYSAFIMCPLIDTYKIGKSVKWNEKLARNQDMEYLTKIYSLCDDYSYVQGYYCNYVKHENGQISESYDKGVPYFTVLKSITSHTLKNIQILSKKRIFDLLFLMLRIPLLYLANRKNILNKRIG